MRERKPPRSFLEPDMVVDLLDVAGEWEASRPGHQRVGRRGLLALLCLAGPRVGELIATDRGDFDLAAGRWRIPEAKTDSGRRDVELTMYLRDELVEHVASMDGLGRAIGAPGAALFRLDPVGDRTEAGSVGGPFWAVERANANRAEEGKQLLPDRITPHTLRSTFASLARGEAQSTVGDGPARARRCPPHPFDLRPGHAAASGRSSGNLAAHAVCWRAREGGVGRGRLAH